jgi:hypothetical protein
VDLLPVIADRASFSAPGGPLKDIPRFFAVPFCNILGESVLKFFTTALSFLTTKDTKVTKIEE